MDSKRKANRQHKPKPVKAAETRAAENLPPEPSAPAAQPEAPQQWQPKKRGCLAAAVLLLLTAAGTAAALYVWRLPPFAGSTVATDNAYVRGQTTLISPRVGGYVSEVLVNDFARVEKGQPLVRIDDAPYAAKVAQAEANLAAQNANLGKMSHSRTSADAGVKAREGAIRNAETQLRLAQANMKRLNSVKGSEGIAQREYEQAQSALEQAQAAYTQAQAMYTVAQQDVLSVESGREGLTAATDAARATVDLAKQELAHTVVYAPASGRLGEVAVKQGQLVSAGSQLMFVVPDRRWIIANFKEADTAAIRIGQKASVAVDALGGQRFSGKVSEIAPATAAEFSLIRADSGTGNFVKIAQRIAVKIELDANQDGLQRLSPGMSVEAQVETAAQ